MYGLKKGRAISLFLFAVGLPAPSVLKLASYGKLVDLSNIIYLKQYAKI